MTDVVSAIRACLKLSNVRARRPTVYGDSLQTRRLWRTLLASFYPLFKYNDQELQKDSISRKWQVYFCVFILKQSEPRDSVDTKPLPFYWTGWSSFFFQRPCVLGTEPIRLWVKTRQQSRGRVFCWVRAYIPFKGVSCELEKGNSMLPFERLAPPKC